jgi:membrane peptidoglycan carboxypeptidase
MVGVQRVIDNAKSFGLTFQSDDPLRAGGLTTALGTLEVNPINLTSAYGVIANGGVNIGRTSILKVIGPDGTDAIPAYEPPEGERVVSAAASGIITDILAGNTDPNANPFWGEWEVKARGGKHRPATIKTGTSNDAKDLNAYGYIAPPTKAQRDAGQYALVIGAWAGNSDATEVTTPGQTPLASLDVTAPLWSAVMTEVTRNWDVNDFRRPDGIVEATVDAHTGYKPSQFSTDKVTELFIKGTEPGDDPYIKGLQVLKASDGKLYRWHDGCVGTPETRGVLDLSAADANHPSWNVWVQDWVARARQGPGVVGGADPTKPNQTAYFYNGGYQPYGPTWGAPFAPDKDCDAAPSPSPSASPSESPSPSPSESPSPSPELTLPPITEPPVTEPPITEPPAPTPPPVTEPPAPTPPPVTEPPLPTPPPVTPPPPEPTPGPTAPPAQNEPTPSPAPAQNEPGPTPAPA